MFPRAFLVAVITVAFGHAAGAANTIALPSLSGTTTILNTTPVLSSTILSLVNTLPAAPTRPAYNCSSTSTSCQQYMPLYDQTNPVIGSYWLPNGGGNSQLCGPTSAAMILAGQMYYGGTVNPPKAGSWTASTFAPLPWYQRVGVMGSLVSCSPTQGTLILPWLTGVFQANGVAGRAGDFTKGGSGWTSFWPTDVQGGDVEPLTRARAGVNINYGHYYQHDTNILGTDYYTYSRNGGHFVNISGFTRNDGNANDDTFTINNPWGGVNQWTRINQLQGGLVWTEHHFWGIPYWTLTSVTILPVVALQAGYWFQSGTYYGILQGFTNLGIN